LVFAVSNFTIRKGPITHVVRDPPVGLKESIANIRVQDATIQVVQDETHPVVERKLHQSSKMKRSLFSKIKLYQSSKRKLFQLFKRKLIQSSKRKWFQSSKNETVPVVQDETVPIVEEETVPEEKEKKEWKQEGKMHNLQFQNSPHSRLPRPRKKKNLYIPLLLYQKKKSGKKEG
jgi:hypothetical protein